MDNIDSSIMKHFHVLQICIFQTIILNRQGWPDFLTTWVRIRNFLSIMLLRLPCYSAYWWVVKAFFEVVRGSVSVWCEQSPLLGRLLNQQQAAGKWFHCKVLNILTSFPWSITVETMKNCCRFVVYNNITSISFEISWKVAHTRQMVAKFGHHHIISMVCIFIKPSSPPISAQEITQLL